MFSVLQRMSLPLLLKELLEQAARRRTYLIRIVYVALLSYFALASIALQLRLVTALNVLGQGAPILTSLVNWQFWGIFLLLPGMACGVLTTEKERNTLALLFLTRLGPWAIIMEKLLSRLVPMLTFLMCGLPVMAFTYSLGGLTVFQLFVAGYYLLLALLLTGCVAVMCSALSNSTIGAFIQCYVVLLSLSVALPIFYDLVPREFLYDFSTLLIGLFESSNDVTSGPSMPAYNYVLGPQSLDKALSPAILFEMFANGVTSPAGSFWLPAIVLGIPSFLASIICLCVTRWALYRRAFVTPSNPLLKFFRGIDKIFFWANRKFSFDVKLVREADSPPGDEPIAWREVSKRSLGQFRYLVRIMIPLMFPVLFVGAMIATSAAGDFRTGGTTGLTGMIWFLWIVCLVLITITATNTIPLERTRQTWDVLRSTPLTGREILTQKLRGVRRLQWVCSIPVFSAIGLQTWLRYQLADPNFLWWVYLAGALGSVVIYSELVKWISLWCGLIFRNSMRAILMSVLTIAAASVLPQLPLMLAVYTLKDLLTVDVIPVVMGILGSMSPWYFTFVNETGNLRYLINVPLMPALINLSIHVGMLWLIHRHLMHRAEWYLERIGVPNAVRTDSSDRIAPSTRLDFDPVSSQQNGDSDSEIASVAESGESVLKSQRIPS
ncbi:MAG: gliding motility-associated transporter permease protein [Planctomycetaceae bacterium]|nr:gliding motility-associated transporter permease protein [Planctomycetaceae bacterium]